MFRSLTNAANNSANKREKFDTSDLINVDVSKTPNESILLPYQRYWFHRKDKIAVDEKSRQIGWSLTHACRANYKALTGERSTIYTCYNKDSTKQFIKDTGFWAKHSNNFIRHITGVSIVKSSELKIFEIRYLSGETVTAVAANPEQLRAKPGFDIILDEAAYRGKFTIDEILAAAKATLIKGGTIRIGSTHAGIDSDFNKFLQSPEVKSGLYGHSKVTFKDAIAVGLYRRLCHTNKEIWTPEKEAKFVAEIYQQYGIRASEELDAIPGDFSQEGSVFTPGSFKKTHYTPTENTIFLRYYDLASSNNESSYYSANVMIAIDTLTGYMVIWDYFADKCAPVEAHQLIIDTIRGNHDKGIPPSPPNCFHIIEKEPGSTVDFYIETLRKECPRATIYEYRPTVSKLTRAFPVANAVLKGELLIRDSWDRADSFIQIISKFSGKKQPLINDLTDCVSGIYDFWHNGEMSIIANQSSLFSNNNFNIYDNDDELLQEFDQYGIPVDDGSLLTGIW